MTFIQAHDEENTAARLLRLMLREGWAMPLHWGGECAAARLLVERGWAVWHLGFWIHPTGAGLAAALELEGERRGGRRIIGVGS